MVKHHFYYAEGSFFYLNFTANRLCNAYHKSSIYYYLNKFINIELLINSGT